MATGGCDLPGLYAEECEAEVLRLLEMIEIVPEDKERIVEMLDTTPTSSRTSPAAIQSRLERLTWLFQEGDITTEEYKRRKAMIQSELDRERPPARGEILQAIDTLCNVAEAWREATSDETQKALLRALFEEIRFDATSGAEPRLITITPQPAFRPYWDALFRQNGAEGIRPGMFQLPPLR